MSVELTITHVLSIQHRWQYDIHVDVVDPSAVTVAGVTKSCENTISVGNHPTFASAGVQARFYYVHRGQLVHLDSDETLRALCATRGQKKLFLKCA
jgi:hypothetical protein